MNDDTTLTYTVPASLAAQADSYMQEAVRQAMRQAFTASMLAAVEPLLEEAFADWQRKNGLLPAQGEDE
jgi:hypothetical protein